MKKKVIIWMLVLCGLFLTTCNTETGRQHADRLISQADALLDKNPAKARLLAEKALRQSNKLNYAKGRASSLAIIGFSLYRAHEYTKAEDYIRKTLRISKTLNEPKLYVVHLKWKAIVLWAKGAYAEAKAVNNTALHLAREGSYTDQRADIFNNLSILYMTKGDLRKALRYARKSLRINIKAGDISKAGKQYENIGIIYKRWGWYDKALEYYFKSLKISEKTNNRQRIAISYNNIAIVYTEFKQYDMSLMYYNKSLALKKELNNQKGIGITYNNIGTLFEKQKKYNKALEYYHKSLKIKLKFADKKSTAYTLGNLGTNYVETKHYHKGIYYYKKALRLRQDVGDHFGQCISLMNLGHVHMKLKQHGRALRYLGRSMKLAKKYNYKKYIKLIHENYMEVYEALGNYRLAHYHSKKYNAIKSNMFTESTGKKINEIKIRYETEKKENEILLLKKEKQFDVMLRNLLILALVLFVALIIVVYQLYTLKKSAHAELEEKHDLVTLDRTTVVKATETISSEIILSALLEKLIKLLVEYSGAGRGVLLLEEEKELLVEAEMVPEENTIKVLQATPLADAAEQLPLKIVRLVHINYEGIILGNAQNDELFITDPYVKQHGVKSIFCVPIIRQKKLVGILYLEHRQEQNVFTPQRIEIFNVLASQIAISIENARFYDNLDHKVRERTREVEKLNDLKNRFLAIVAHDLKNPLKDLMLRLDMLNAGENGTEQADMFKNMKITAEYMYRLLDELLDIAIIESGKVELNFARNDYAAFIHEKIESKQLLAAENRVELLCDIQDDIPLLYFDTHKINQVLDNLISNALKYSPEETKIMIEVEKGERQVVTRVIDQGPGIPEEEKDTIFDEFARSSAQLRKGEKSTGLGLAIVKKIINAHMGDVGVASTPGNGAAFYFTLPVYYDE